MKTISSGTFVNPSNKNIKAIPTKKQVKIESIQ